MALIMSVRIIHWDFSPSFLPTFITLLVFPALLWLGFWQLDRAEQKHQIINNFQRYQNSNAVNFDSIKDRQMDEQNHWKKLRLHGKFIADTHILLDNQVMQQTAGYFVYTPFSLAGKNHFVLVNRGWIPVGKTRNVVPDISTEQVSLSIIGRIKSPPWTGILLGGEETEKMSSSIYRVQRLEIDNIQQFTTYQFLPYIIRLEPESPGGYLRQWPTPGSGKEKHLAYAFQWFFLAFTLIIIYLVVNTKKT